MRRDELAAATIAAREETREALQTMFDALPPGQKSRLVRDEEVKAILDRYGVEY